MPETKIGSAVSSNLSNVQTDFSVDAQTTDAGGEQKETSWDNPNWTQYLGYYKEIPELNTAIDAKATWTVGKGYKADEVTTILLDAIKGYGIDTFNTILENCVRTYHIGGDSFCEIIRDDEGNLINLKPLDPGIMTIIVNSQGMLLRYEQRAKTKDKKPKKFKPEDIFHLARNRVADEIHGVSIIEKLEKIILWRNEAMQDMRILQHRNVKPIRLWHLDTDDTSEIAKFKSTIDKATENAENIYMPKDTVETEIAAVPTNATLNPLPWIETLNNYFFEACGVPQIVVGGTGAITEAAVKIAYLAFQQTIEEEQLYIEEEVLAQLNIVLELEFPASLENELLSDKSKDGAENIDANDTTAGRGQ